MIQSLDRALRLVDLISATEGIGCSELSKKIGLERTTVFRLLETLLAHKYVGRNPITKKYTLGGKVLDLASKARKEMRFQDMGRPFLKKLAQMTGETAHLAVFNEGEVIIVDQEIGSHRIGVHTFIGMREPVYCTALGKALLSQLGDREIMGIVKKKKFSAYTKNTITTLVKLKKAINLARNSGYALDDEEYKAGIRCLAAPVLDHRGVAVAAIGISGPADRVTKKKLDYFSKIIREIGGNFSEQIGYRPEK